HANVWPVAQDGAEPAEELRAIAGKLLHALGEREVQSLSQVGQTGLRVLVALLRDVERGLERGDLPPQRADLLIEQLDLGERACGDALLHVQLVVERADLALRRAGAAAEAFIEPLDAIALALRAGQARAQLRDRLLEARLAGLFHRQHVGEL